jgi:cytoskeletal protein CcmA (bactofilin family)
MQIQGELTGREDLTIDGSVEGRIVLHGHRLTIAKNGKIKAEVTDAASVVVHGQLVGNITATDSVEVAATGMMEGDIRAPRVALAEGARFRGRIDMSPAPGKEAPK